MDTQMTLQPNILIVDDDSSLLTSYTVLLEDDYRLLIAESGEEGMKILQEEDINIILLDIRLPGMDGMEFLRRAKAIDENVDVIMVTAVKNVRVAVEAIKLGAYDYLVKPFEIDEVLSLLRRTMERQNLMREVLYLRAEVDRHQGMDNIVGQSAKMRQIYDLICRVADTNATVLVNGESGTGKELVARAIHQQSQRRPKPFVAVNCAAISEHLIESELFGHERGAFTGAVEKHLGKFESANTGVLFLDEVGSLRLDLQAKLLRVLQEREVVRVGGSKTIRSTSVSWPRRIRISNS
jgi:DNA-binding NtrC family response regulator